MTQPTRGDTELGDGRFTCTGCPLLCDDISVGPGGVQRACGHGEEIIRQSVADHAPTAAPAVEAGETAGPLDRHTAMNRAAALLTSARRVLVTGLAGATLESIASACDLAEAIGAAVDSGLPDASRLAGPTIARAGEVTASFEELRDRADLVIFWCCDPNVSHPRFIERFLAPSQAAGRERCTISLGPDGVMPPASTHRHLSLARGCAVEAARLLHMRLAGRHRVAGDTPLSATCDVLEEAIRSAGCVAIVTGDADDPVGLESWSIVHLVRTIAHERPAFQIPLGPGLAAAAINGAGASAVCAWRYGAAGAIARADRLGGPFLPAESDARRLIDRGEVDTVLALGRLSGPLERAIADRGAGVAVVRIGDAAEAARSPAARSIHLRCAAGAIATTGTMLREDGRRVVLIPHRRATLPQMQDLLVDLTGAVRASLAARADGGRP